MGIDKYKYELIVLGKTGTMDANSPQEAIEKAVKELKLKLLNIQPASSSNYNAATRLIANEHGAVRKESVNYYIIQVEQSAQVVKTETLLLADHGKIKKSQVYYVKYNNRNIILQAHEELWHDEAYLELNMCDEKGNIRKFYRTSDYSLKTCNSLDIFVSNYKRFEDYKESNPGNIFINHKECMCTQNPISIKKEVGKKKEAFRCIDEASIPSILRTSVKVKDGDVYLNSLEGVEKISLSNRPVIAYEKIDPSKVENANRLKPNANGELYNVWWKKNADTTLIEKDGAFYTIDNLCQVCLATSIWPAFLGDVEDMLKRDDKNNGWLYRVSWSPDPLRAKNRKGFWVKYGERDFNFLEMGTPSADQYIVCDENGNKKMTLNEYYRTLMG